MVDYPQLYAFISVFGRVEPHLVDTVVLGKEEEIPSFFSGNTLLSAVGWVLPKEGDLLSLISRSIL